MSLVAMTLALVMTQDSPLPILEIGTLPDSGYVSLLAMDGEGRWVGWGDHKGQVAASELAEIKKAIDEARLSTIEGPRCTTTPVLQLVRTRRGEVRFAETCGPMAHPTLNRLVELAKSLTVRRTEPMVVRLDRWRAGEELRKESIILKKSGIWSRDNAAGNTGGAELQALIDAFEKAELAPVTVAPAPDCRGDHIHELDVPGRGKVRWIAPCQGPSPSLTTALDLLFKLVGLPN